MPLTEAGIYYADTSTTMSIADITAAMATSMGEALTVLQVVQNSYSSQVVSSSNGYSDTGLSASITPKFATSKILVMVSHPSNYKSNGNALNGLWIQLMRGGIFLVEAVKNQLYTGTTIELAGGFSFNYIDSPATTSSVTYKTQFRNQVAAAQVGVNLQNSPSTITLIEVAG